MDFKETRYFLTIAQEGSISRAAEKLFVAQSSLSHFLKTLEASLGCKLFERVPEGVKLTQSGERVYLTMQQIANLNERLKNELADLENLRAGCVRVGMTTIRAPFLLPSALKRFNALYPHIRVEILEGNSEELENAVLSGALDLSVSTLPLNHPDLVAEHVLDEEVFLAARHGHPILDRARGVSATGYPCIELSLAAEYPFVLLARGRRLHAFAMREFQKNAMQPLIMHQTTSIELIFRLVETGMALAMIPETYAVTNPKLSLLSLSEQAQFRELVLVYPRGSYRPRATQAFSAILADEILALHGAREKGRPKT